MGRMMRNRTRRITLNVRQRGEIKSVEAYVKLKQAILRADDTVHNNRGHTKKEKQKLLTLAELSGEQLTLKPG